MTGKPRESEGASEKPSVTLPGKVEKIIPGVVATMPDKAQIAVEETDHLYKEIRVENTLSPMLCLLQQSLDSCALHGVLSFRTPHLPTL